MITYDSALSKQKIPVVCHLTRRYSRIVATKKDFIAFRVMPTLKDDIEKIADAEARSISQICELLLSEGVDSYKREGPRFIQRLIAKQKSRTK